jgi:hypothetical protein
MGCLSNLSSLGCPAFSELVFGRRRVGCCFGGWLPPDIASGFYPVSLIYHSRDEAGWKTSTRLHLWNLLSFAVPYALNGLLFDEIQL